MTDPIADMLTRLRNGLGARHDKVDMPASSLKMELARILKEEGYVNSYKRTENDGKPVLTVVLKYGPAGEQVVTSLQRVSRPGCRVYVGSKEIPKVLSGLGVNILSTSGGVMTGREARKSGFGGEILCDVY
jgi:small subunit ribosomal protein S8